MLPWVSLRGHVPFWAAFLLAWCGQDPADASRMADSEKLLPGTVETRNSAWEAVSDVCLHPMPPRTSSSWGSWRSGWNRGYLLPQDIPLYSKSTVGYYLGRRFYKISTLAVVPQRFPSQDFGILFILVSIVLECCSLVWPGFKEA